MGLTIAVIIAVFSNPCPCLFCPLDRACGLVACFVSNFLSQIVLVLIFKGLVTFGKRTLWQNVILLSRTTHERLRRCIFPATIDGRVRCVKAKLNGGFIQIWFKISLLINAISACLSFKLMFWFLLLELILYRVTNYDRLVTILANSIQRPFW